MPTLAVAFIKIKRQQQKLTGSQCSGCGTGGKMSLSATCGTWQEYFKIPGRSLEVPQFSLYDNSCLSFSTVSCIFSSTIFVLIWVMWIGKSLRGIGRRSETELGGTETERKGANRGAGLCFFLMLVFSKAVFISYDICIMVVTCFYHFLYQVTIDVLIQIWPFRDRLNFFFRNSLYVARSKDHRLHHGGGKGALKY